MVEGEVQRESMDSLALSLSAADSREEAGPGRVSALASPDQGRDLKGVGGEGRDRQPATQASCPPSRKCASETGP